MQNFNIATAKLCHILGWWKKKKKRTVCTAVLQARRLWVWIPSRFLLCRVLHVFPEFKWICSSFFHHEKHVHFFFQFVDFTKSLTKYDDEMMKRKWVMVSCWLLQYLTQKEQKTVEWFFFICISNALAFSAFLSPTCCHSSLEALISHLSSPTAQYERTVVKLLPLTACTVLESTQWRDSACRLT